MRLRARRVVARLNLRGAFRRALYRIVELEC